jgi:hypothetical protein
MVENNKGDVGGNHDGDDTFFFHGGCGLGIRNG